MHTDLFILFLLFFFSLSLCFFLLSWIKAFLTSSNSVHVSCPLLPIHSHWALDGHFLPGLILACILTWTTWMMTLPDLMWFAKGFYGHSVLSKLNKQDLSWAFHSVSQSLFGSTILSLCTSVYVRWPHWGAVWDILLPQLWLLQIIPVISSDESFRRVPLLASAAVLGAFGFW